MSEPSRVDGPKYCSRSVGVSGESRPGSVRERRMERPAELRFVTYLSPGIPRAFYEAVVDHVRHALGRPASLLVESRVSGPMRGTDDPFSRGEADVGFMCAPSFFWLRELKDPPVELLPAAPVFRDSRTPGQPAYFSEVIVHRENPVRSFSELRGCSWAYNDVCSLSGYYNLLKKLAEMNEDGGFFGRMCCSESHSNSIELVAQGEVDAAAIDSNVLSIKLRSAPDLRERLRIIESWGPFPIQPVVLRSSLHPELKDRLRAALLTIGAGPYTSTTFDGFGLERFAPVTYEHYASEERALRECERALGV
jgi:phosphonate transport system substrate-binding protein